MRPEHTDSIDHWINNHPGIAFFLTLFIAVLIGAAMIWITGYY